MGLIVTDIVSLSKPDLAGGLTDVGGKVPNSAVHVLFVSSGSGLTHKVEVPWPHIILLNQEAAP